MTAPAAPMTIEQLKKLQADEELGDVHLVELLDGGFTMAHTDAERASGMDLSDCAFHRHLCVLDQRPDVEKPGIYVMLRHEPDPVSESFRGDADPYAYEPLESIR